MRNQTQTQAIYEFIRTYIKENGFSPSLREIARNRYMSVTNVIRYLDKLQMAGRVTREENVPRSIVLLEDDEIRK